jgi:AcrR family transcriptional regulator
MRADARDNRERILHAADEVFGVGGAAASTEEVARLAGVGIATVFRHFPTKQDLLRAVLTARLEGLRDRARDLSQAADPGAAFRDFFEEVVDGASQKLSIAESLADVGGDTEGAPTWVGEEMRDAFGDLLVRAQQAGAIRSDVARPEVYALMVGVSRATAHVPMSEPVKQRMLALALDGLRHPTRPEPGST